MPAKKKAKLPPRVFSSVLEPMVPSFIEHGDVAAGCVIVTEEADGVLSRKEYRPHPDGIELDGEEGTYRLAAISRLK